MRLYFDTTTWIRPFEVGDSNVNLQSTSVNEILKHNFDIISSKFQHRQLSYLLRNESILEKKQNYQYARDLEEYYCPNSINIFTHYNAELPQLLSQTMLNHREDGIHILIACMRNADYFITADKELYLTKKRIIEQSLHTINPLQRTNSNDIEILDPIFFRRIVRI